MAVRKSAPRVQENGRVTGTGNVELRGAYSEIFFAFSQAYSPGDAVPYTIVGGGKIEVGDGTYLDEDTFRRDTVWSTTDNPQNSTATAGVAKIAFDTNTDVLIFNAAHPWSILQTNTDGTLANASPFRRTIALPTIDAMQAADGLEDKDAVFVLETGRWYYWDEGNATSPDDENSFSSDNYDDGLWLIVGDNIGTITVDSATGGDSKIDLFSAKKGSNPNNFFRLLTEASASAMHWAARLGQSSVTNFLSMYSQGTAADRIEAHKPLVLPSATDSTSFVTRTLAWLSGVSRLGLQMAGGGYREVALTKGGYIVADVIDIYALKQIDAGAVSLSDGDRAVVRGTNTSSGSSVITNSGNSSALVYYWNSTSSTTADDINVVRPAVGAAASGNGRWLILKADITRTMTSGDASPTVAGCEWLITAGTTAITDFDDAYEGQIVTIQRGAADIVITHDGTKIDLGGANLTLKAANPTLTLINIAGVWRPFGGGIQGNALDLTMSNLASLTEAQSLAARLKLLSQFNHTFVATDPQFGTITGNDPCDNLLAAIAAAPAVGVTRIILPKNTSTGVWIMSKTVSWGSRIHVTGNGQEATICKRTGNYGHTFVIGASGSSDAYCSGLHDIWAYHDHGNGFLAPLDATTWTNAVSYTDSNGIASTHLMLYHPTHCQFSNLFLNLLPYQVYCWGGDKSTFRNIVTSAFRHPTTTARQEGIAGLVLDYNSSINAKWATDHSFYECQFGGTNLLISQNPGLTDDYGGGHTSAGDVVNAGPTDNVLIKAAENIEFNGGYIGTARNAGVSFMAQSGISCQGFSFTSVRFDHCKEAQIMFDTASAGDFARQININGCIFNSQGNSKRGIYAKTVSGNLSVCELTITGNSFNSQLSAPITINSARNVTISGNSAKNWNSSNWYSADATQNCGVYVASTAVTVTVVGNTLGGDNDGANSGSNYCVNKVYAVDASASSLVCFANGGYVTGAELAGSYSRVNLPVSGGGTNAVVVGEGSSADVSLGLRSKGSGEVFLESNTRGRIATFNAPGTLATSWLFYGAAAGNALVASVLSSDTNVNIEFRPKGSGVFNVATGGYAIGGTTVLTGVQTGWGTPTGTLTRSVLAAYAGNTHSGTYDQTKVQALDDAVKAASQALAALITDLKAGKMPAS